MKKKIKTVKKLNSKQMPLKEIADIVELDISKIKEILGLTE